MKAIYWVRNDLRINDNLTLDQFNDSTLEKIAVWTPTKSYLRAKKFRAQFINENLKSHALNLSSIGVDLNISEIVFYEYLIQNAHINNIHEIYFTKEYSVEELAEEKKIREFCYQNKIALIEVDQSTLIKELDLPFEIASMPLIFTDFRKKVEAKLIINSPSLKFSHIELTERHKGEKAAQARIQEFIWNTKSILTYKDTRNGMIEYNDSSKFSPWLSIGAISARSIYNEVKKFEAKHGANESTYWLIFELLWRDYFKFLAKKSGPHFFQRADLTKKTSHSKMDLSLFQSWCEGKTSEPFINANMKELNATGFMSNRGRQNVASFLIHDLKLPWTIGAKYFEEMLIDYDAESNWGNWLYLSGHGTDPRSRIFNIKKQAHDYDPHGNYQKKWIKNE